MINLLLKIKSCINKQKNCSFRLQQNIVNEKFANIFLYRLIKNAQNQSNLGKPHSWF